MMISVYGVEKVIDFCRINSFKYRMRAGHKDDIESDIKKALWYENKASELSSSNDNSNDSSVSLDGDASVIETIRYKLPLYEVTGDDNCVEVKSNSTSSVKYQIAENETSWEFSKRIIEEISKSQKSI